LRDDSVIPIDSARRFGDAPVERARLRARLRIGRLWIDSLTRESALAELEALVAARRGGAIYTPNVDHIVMAERNEAFVRAYDRASLTFADGVPVMWASRLLRPALPEKLSGSDMVWPIAKLAGERSWRLYLLGGSPGAAAEAAVRLRRDYGVNVVGVDDSRVPRHADAAADGAVLERIRRARPDLVFVGLGAPKQELFVDRMWDQLTPAVSIGVGASIDFIAGRLRRSPAILSSLGLEWLYRLAQEPRRLWRRYLLQDPRFVVLVARMLQLPVSERVRHVPTFASGARAKAPATSCAKCVDCGGCENAARGTRERTAWVTPQLRRAGVRGAHSQVEGKHV
jgi:N-acetylglucosaminyldiphosphoundecaprenol N-acetyl-beta-D-mannosaminyltransferase